VLASCVAYGTSTRTDSGSYRIPIALQLLWTLILGAGLLLLPESPRYFVKKGELDKAAAVLSHVRGQPQDSDYIQQELAEIVANTEYELQVIPQGGYFISWLNCFQGDLFKANSNVRRTILGTSLQMMQQYINPISLKFFSQCPNNLVQMDRCQLHLLLRYHFLRGLRHNRKSLLGDHYYRHCQCLFHLGIFLGHGESGPSPASDLGRFGYGYLPVSRRDYRRFRWPEQPRRQCDDLLYLHLHLFLCHHLGPWRLGCHWRDFPPANSCPRRRPLHRIELALELRESLPFFNPIRMLIEV
jgi:Sugar (and other) transporter